MKTTKYLNIRMDGEKNIGVISVEVHSTADKKLSVSKGKSPKVINTSFQLTGKGGVEQKLVEALSSHFDCEVTIINSTVKNATNPLEIEVDVIIKSMDEDHQEVVHLEETWLY